ncbi:hypothetical protein [Bernardetia sp.]|uniref:hypothetical protein n=1 Tax=Bernardetia sp. TaxID=1937974 RepID=UPI0025C15323|nr:hypothetical protein [Bernardetia sp.]
MKIDIAKNSNYEIYVDTDKNRSYIKVIGKWMNRNQVKDFFPDWKKAVSYMKPNFTIFADIRLLGSMSKEVENLHQEIQAYLVEQGLLLTAQLASVDELADYQIHRSTQRSGLAIIKFSTQDEAERYLDEVASEVG